MPNWCENRWSITCNSEKEAQMIFDLLTKEVTRDDRTEREVTFNKLVPMPEILGRVIRGSKQFATMIEDTDAEGKDITRERTPEEEAAIKATGFADWYDWSIANWGTKWDARTDFAERSHDLIELRFDTAWGPPVAFHMVFAARFPNVGISAFYDEPLMEFAGYLKAEP